MGCMGLAGPGQTSRLNTMTWGGGCARWGINSKGTNSTMGACSDSSVCKDICWMQGQQIFAWPLSAIPYKGQCAQCECMRCGHRHSCHSCH